MMRNVSEVPTPKLRRMYKQAVRQADKLERQGYTQIPTGHWARAAQYAAELKSRANPQKHAPYCTMPHERGPYCCYEHEYL